LGRSSAAIVIATCFLGAAAPLTCPQPRFTGKAPDEYHGRRNALEATPQAIAAGEALFQGDRRKISCASCHGEKGDGQGRLSNQFDPPPRNFACKDTINGVPDGQLFWIIRHGSPGTSMPPNHKLTDEQTWQLVHYIRTLAR
jgi:mono/diheme cytochrome c family protein